jgi:hypothetical protein
MDTHPLADLAVESVGIMDREMLQLDIEAAKALLLLVDSDNRPLVDEKQLTALSLVQAEYLTVRLDLLEAKKRYLALNRETWSNTFSRAKLLSVSYRHKEHVRNFDSSLDKLQRVLTQSGLSPLTHMRRFREQLLRKKVTSEEEYSTAFRAFEDLLQDQRTALKECRRLESKLFSIHRKIDVAMTELFSHISSTNRYIARGWFDYRLFRMLPVPLEALLTDNPSTSVTPTDAVLAHLEEACSASSPSPSPAESNVLAEQLIQQHINSP